jgi:hypothetical protein
MRVPDFLVRQFYVAGSLQQEGDGFRLQARNGIGDGTLVGIRSLTVDGETVNPASITATRAGDERVLRASDVSPGQPVSFRRDDVVTLHVAGFPLSPGEHRFEVEIIEVNAGTLTLALKDTLRSP